MTKRWVALVALVGCDDGTAGDPYTQVVEVSVNPNRDLDILFVIDDSPSMFDKQKNLADNFPKFIDRLNASSAGSRTCTSGRHVGHGTKGARSWHWRRRSAGRQRRL